MASDYIFGRKPFPSELNQKLIHNQSQTVPIKTKHSQTEFVILNISQGRIPVQILIQFQFYFSRVFSTSIYKKSLLYLNICYILIFIFD